MHKLARVVRVITNVCELCERHNLSEEELSASLWEALGSLQKLVSPATIIQTQAFMIWQRIRELDQIEWVLKKCSKRKGLKGILLCKSLLAKIKQCDGELSNMLQVFQVRLLLICVNLASYLCIGWTWIRHLVCTNCTEKRGKRRPILYQMYFVDNSTRLSPILGQMKQHHKLLSLVLSYADVTSLGQSPSSQILRRVPGCHILIGLHILHRYVGLPFSFSFLLPFTKAHVQYGSDLKLCTIRSDDLWRCTIWSCSWSLYNTDLRATSTTILSTRGVTIPIDLVSSATDSIRWCVVLCKPVTVLTSDPKSEFLCQSSLYCTEPADSLNHLVHLGYLPHPCHHVSLILSSSKCSHRVP